MTVEEDGQAFGVLIFNSNAQDYKLDEFENNQAMLTYRTLGGILDVFFFAGPRPEDVIRQYQTVIGTPYMPPYWALGFQLCRYGYDTLDNMKAAMQRTLDANIPLDIMSVEYVCTLFTHSNLSLSLGTETSIIFKINWISLGIQFVSKVYPNMSTTFTSKA